MKTLFQLSLLLFIQSFPLFSQKMTDAQVGQAEKEGKRKYEISGSFTQSYAVSKADNSDDTTIIYSSSELNSTNHIIKKRITFPEKRKETLNFKGVAMMEIMNDDSQNCNWSIHTNENEQDWVNGSAMGTYEHQMESYDFDQSTLSGRVKNGNTNWQNVYSFGQNETHFSEFSNASLNKLGIFQFCYNPKSKYWNVEIDFPVVKNVKLRHWGEQIDSEHAENNKTWDDPENTTDEHRFQINGSSEVNYYGCAITLSGKTFIVNCTKNKTERNENGQDITTQTTAQFRIQPYSDFEAFIEPDNSLESYKEWVPEGSKPDEATESTGNFALFKVYVKDKRRPQERITASIKQVKYSIEGVSHEPGYAMNFPVENPSTKADLQLCKLEEKPNPEQEKLALTLTKTEQSELKVSVQSFDYGSYGKLKALVTLDSGEELEATVAETHQNFMPIPFRENTQSQVSDNWKKDKNASDLSDNDDDEKGENGIGDHRGDGLSLYEEYRGFIENKKHFRADPKKKDLMVCNMITFKPERAKDGINLFTQVTHLAVHDEFQLDEFGQKCDPEAEGTNHDKIINFNSTPATHLVDQHGIAMVNSLERKGYARAVTKKGKKISTPKNYKYLEITPDFNPDDYNVVEADGQSGFKRGTKIISEDYGHTVAHEMLHCCNVKHHGDIDIGNLVLKRGSDLDPKVFPDVDANKIYEIVQDTLIYSDNLYFENEQRVTLNSIKSPDGNQEFVGVKHGQHSGFEDCIMRYRAASAYVDNGNIYLVSVSDGYNNGELAGLQLCASPKGTGVNAPDHQPHSRYGDADIGRGNCKHQVCINDKYH